MEISGTFELMLPIGLASVIAYAVSTLVVEEPMYETLLDNLLASRRA
jgi:H+/Cl- antiporter ClcA